MSAVVVAGKPAALHPARDRIRTGKRLSANLASLDGNMEPITLLFLFRMEITNLVPNNRHKIHLQP